MNLHFGGLNTPQLTFPLHCDKKVWQIKIGEIFDFRLNSGNFVPNIGYSGLDSRGSESAVRNAYILNVLVIK